ncbi:MAG: hypothetical protein ACNA71_02275 [Kiritimatiellia bacterium]
MRGRPLLELLLLVCVWCLLFWPLWNVTRSGARVVLATEAIEDVRAAVWVQVRFTEAPVAFRLYSQGALIWDAAVVDVEQEQPLEMVWNVQSQGDLVLVAVWSTAARRVTEVRVAPPVGPPRSVTLWHEDDEIEEPLLFR